MPKYPSEAPFEEILLDADQYVDGVFSCLESEFLVMPKGVGFIEYPVFERGYEALKAATRRRMDDALIPGPLSSPPGARTS